MPRHVALVSEASGVSGVSERDAAGDLALHADRKTIDKITGGSKFLA
jgi:hypothetical protein